MRADAAAIAETLGRASREAFEAVNRKARSRTSAHAVDRMTETDARGRVRFLEQPPVRWASGSAVEAELKEVFERYRGATRADVALLLSKFTLTDIARRVVGSGSVGTRCYVLALTCLDGGNLVLQVKQALPLRDHHGSDAQRDHAHGRAADAPGGLRVMAHQARPPGGLGLTLGHLEAERKHYYVRQFRDMKGSLEVRACGQPIQGVRHCLRATARSRPRPESDGALGGRLPQAGGSSSTRLWSSGRSPTRTRSRPISRPSSRSGARICSGTGASGRPR